MLVKEKKEFLGLNQKDVNFLLYKYLSSHGDLSFDKYVQNMMRIKKGYLNKLVFICNQEVNLKDVYMGKISNYFFHNETIELTELKLYHKIEAKRYYYYYDSNKSNAIKYIKNIKKLELERMRNDKISNNYKKVKNIHDTDVFTINKNENLNIFVRKSEFSRHRNEYNFHVLPNIIFNKFKEDRGNEVISFVSLPYRIRNIK